MIRQLLPALAAASILLTLAPPSRAEVTGIGDITPAKEDPDNPGTMIPDLPLTGGPPVIPLLTVGGTGLMIGGTDTGQMIIDSPAFTAPLYTTDAIIGGNAVGSGLVQIFTSGSQWLIERTLVVGREGQGTLELTNGGQVSDNPTDPASTDLEVVVGQLSGSQGFLRGQGTGSLMRTRFLFIGEEGFGQMSLTTRARVETTQEAIIGNQATGVDIGTGYVSVDGQLTRWTIGGTAAGSGTGNLIVGNEGRGALTITNQGEVRVTNPTGTNGNVTIGAAAAGLGEVTVNGLFSQLWAFGSIAVSDADNGRGVLRIQNQGLVRANAGVTIGANGVMELAGGSLFTPTTASVVNNGVIQTAVGSIGQVDSAVTNAALGEIRTAGTVDRVRERLLFTRGVTNAGLITSIGGEMEFSAAIVNTGTIAGRDAIYRFRDPASPASQLVNNGVLGFSVGVSDVFGTVLNNGTIGVANDTVVTFYDDVTGAGELSVLPGGTAVFVQDFNLVPTSVVSIHINQVANVEQVGMVQVFGDTQLDGALNIFAGAGFDDDESTSYEIISGTNILGTFDVVNFPAAPGNNWSIDYLPAPNNATSVVINYDATAPAFDADFDNNNIVNGLDLAIWRANNGTMVPPGTMGDANFDGQVDGSDFLIWQRHLGQTQATPAAGAVPEPSAAGLALAAALALGMGRRRR